MMAAPKETTLNPDTKRCIICTKTSSSSELSKPKDAESRRTLLDAAKLQHFEAIVDLSEEEFEDKLVYHRKCRSNFTHKKTLDRFRQQQVDQSTTPEPRTSTRARELPSTSSRVLDDVCIFCDKKNKYILGSKTREPLSLSLELRSDETVRSVALKKLDDKILAITSRELVAAEARYHKSCYKADTRTYICDTKAAEPDTAETRYHEREQQAYQMLFDHVRETLFNQPQVVKLTALTDVLLNNLRTIGFPNENIQSSTKKHIRRKLEGEFAESLHFIQADNGRVLVYPDNLSFDQLVNENMQMKEKLSCVASKDEQEKALKSAATHIRSEIRNLEAKPWPPSPDELNLDYVKLPESILIFLSALLGLGDTETEELPAKSQRIINSLGQDCVYAVTGGRVIPAKHILLPWAIKSLTGNVELMKTLNRRGHGMSYSKLEEMDTALCMNKLSMEPELGVVLPTKTYPCVPTTMAFDNIDRLEETLSGGGTSHRVNGIIVQPEMAYVPPLTKPKQDQQV